MKSYIRIAPDVEYFTDYDRFREEQICCAVAEDGTSLFSRIENRRFMHTVRHDLSERVIELLCRQIHREICTLRYGGQERGMTCLPHQRIVSCKILKVLGLDRALLIEFNPESIPAFRIFRKEDQPT